MTVKIRSALKRTVVVLIAAGMILGLINVAACDETYDTVCRVCDYQNEMSAPVMPVMADLIAETSANVDLTRFLTERGSSERKLFSSSDNYSQTVIEISGILSLNLCTFLVCVLLVTSFKQIFYIHLKDGNK